MEPIEWLMTLVLWVLGIALALTGASLHAAGSGPWLFLAALALLVTAPVLAAPAVSALEYTPAEWTYPATPTHRHMSFDTAILDEPTVTIYDETRLPPGEEIECGHYDDEQLVACNLDAPWVITYYDPRIEAATTEAFCEVHRKELTTDE